MPTSSRFFVEHTLRELEAMWPGSMRRLARHGPSRRAFSKQSGGGGWGSSLVAQPTSTYVSNKAMQDAKVQEVLPRLLALGRGLEGGRALDLCCGDGSTTAGLPLDFCHAVVGCDVSIDMIEHAQKVHGTDTREFAVADVTSLPYDSEFDLCMSFNSLHWVPLHLHGDILAGIRRALRPGGCALLEFEAEGSMQALLDCYQETADRWSLNITPAADLARPSVEHYSQLLASSGFGDAAQVEAIPHTSRHPGKAGLRSRIRGAWQAFPSLMAALPEAADRNRFGDELTEAFVNKYPPDEHGFVNLRNSLMCVTIDLR